MPYCPDCRMEYQEGASTCADCGQTLVSGVMPSGPPGRPAEEKWICLLRVNDEESALIVRGMLETAGIECEMIDKRAAEMPVPVVDAISRLEIWVPAASAAQARHLLDSARDEMRPCPACGHTSSAQDRVCEYCGAAL